MVNDHYLRVAEYQGDYVDTRELEQTYNPDLKKYYIPEGNEYGKDR